MSLPLSFDSETQQVFYAAFSDELVKLSSAASAAHTAASGILTEGAKQTLKGAAPALVAGGLAVHYGKKTSNDWRQGRTSRRMQEMSRLQGGY